ncbi:C-terminal processing protease CtpA/Prc [Pedobacter cryoconitis]|uniref:C-terminal processing protease CtpA/Prc n=1 Tax=Pedobacter cryoconitis TaxID=188932 RepID=A0A7W9DJX6_9SPHI|nr:S41 family peptidase [Pedobacter cryoconitis]MBB5621666.1 C-terminal processing protease CtpA/Prc [Pedobacter cryoconitis]
MKRIALIIPIIFLYNLAFSQITPRQERNLTAFAKLYGYINYFHPSDEARKLDWQVLAVYGSQVMVNVKTDQELVLALKKIFNPVAPAAKIFLTSENLNFSLAEITPKSPETFKIITWQHLGIQLPINTNGYSSIRLNRKPDLINSNDQTKISVLSKPLFKKNINIGDYEKKQLVPGISCIFPLALYGNQAHTFPQADTAEYSSFVKSINNALPKDSTGKLNIAGSVLEIRLADIIITWNILKHGFPYWKDASQSPETILHNSFVKAFQDKTAHDFFNTLKLMAVPLNDGHMLLALNDKNEIKNNFSVPLILVKAEDKVVVKDILDENLKKTINYGDIIDSIGNYSANEALQLKEKYISGSAQWKEYKALLTLTDGSGDSVLRLSVRKGHTVQKTDMSRTMPATNYRAGSFSTKPVESGWLKDKLYYLNLTKDSLTNTHINKMSTAESIIIDLRGYPTTDSATNLIAHLIDKPERTRWLKVPEIIYPDYEKVTYQEDGWDLEPIGPRLTKKIFFLTDASAMSYAESLLGFVKDLKLGTIVGQATAGTNGSMNVIYLPGKYIFPYTGMMVTNHTGGKHHLIGIQPDVLIAPTITGLKNQKDEVLEKAIELTQVR